MITVLTISAQLILISGLVPNSPMEWTVLFYGIIFHLLEFIVWYMLAHLVCSRWGSSPRAKRRFFCGRAQWPKYSDIFTRLCNHSQFIIIILVKLIEEVMLTEDEKKLIQFNIALRIYNNCRPHCIQQKQSEERERVRCFGKNVVSQNSVVGGIGSLRRNRR